jgi:hypothetical protein
MAAIGNPFFWLINQKKISSKTIWPNKATFYRKHLSSFHLDWKKKHGRHGKPRF